MSKRIALLIGNYVYQDKLLSQLKKSDANVPDLAAVLCSPAIGDFDIVETIINQPSSQIRDRISDLYKWKKRHDMLLLYFSGHAVLDGAGQLYLAAVDTFLDSLTETAISAASITASMDRSFSRQQILMLDCNYIGIAAQESITDLEPGQLQPHHFKGRGYGRVVLTASDTIHYFVAGNQTYGQLDEPVFTECLIQSLRSGAADVDGDGQIEIGELYQYLLDQIPQPARNRPCLWPYGKQDQVIIARVPISTAEKWRSIKWDLIFGAIMAPLATIVIGSAASLSTSVGMAGLFLLLYAVLYRYLD